MIVDVTIGWTKSDMANGYSSFNGYKPGAQQHTETVHVVVTEEDAALRPEQVVEKIADAAFAATNSPGLLSALAAQIRKGIKATGYRGEGAHYSLSVGDTVTVNEVTLACEDFGWKRVGMVAS